MRLEAAAVRSTERHCGRALRPRTRRRRRNDPKSPRNAFRVQSHLGYIDPRFSQSHRSPSSLLAALTWHSAASTESKHGDRRALCAASVFVSCNAVLGTIATSFSCGRVKVELTGGRRRPDKAAHMPSLSRSAMVALMPHCFTSLPTSSSVPISAL